MIKIAPKIVKEQLEIVKITSASLRSASIPS
jgi:hypothetical protein